VWSTVEGGTTRIPIVDHHGPEPCALSGLRYAPMGAAIIAETSRLTRSGCLGRPRRQASLRGTSSKSGAAF
jgi:hypothetical protein